MKTAAALGVMFQALEHLGRDGRVEIRRLEDGAVAVDLVHGPSYTRHHLPAGALDQVVEYADRYAGLLR